MLSLFGRFVLPPGSDTFPHKTLQRVNAKHSYLFLHIQATIQSRSTRIVKTTRHTHCNSIRPCCPSRGSLRLQLNKPFALCGRHGRHLESCRHLGAFHL